MYVATANTPPITPRVFGVRYIFEITKDNVHLVGGEGLAGSIITA